MSTNDQTKQTLAAELLAAYKAADDEVTRLKSLLEEANKTRSNAVKIMHDNLGKGPYTYKGEYLGKIVARGDTFFLRSSRDGDAIKIN